MSDTLSLNNLPIGFFDSGVGGLSVLKEAMKLLPNENFIYFGDSKNAPYGTKTVDEVKELTFRAVDFLLSKNVKSIVIACNTATSAAIDDLRSFYKNIPIIGIEPALKPAVELNKDGKIIIMATPMTLAEAKFNNLMKSYADTRDIVPLPCAGLAELIESGLIEGTIINSYLKDKLTPYLSESISSIVLGCTHYPFVKNELLKIITKETAIIDGSAGTAKQLKRQLANMSALNYSNSKGSIEIINSLNDEDIIELSYELLDI
ncbi:glutamate racemase [Clostridiales bacterium oral taxon 876 str. F0540]|nr:glutamate racemase [Clostridiales bacterium oral taxon 876 str. F0540]